MKKLLSILLICTIFHATCGQIFAECCNNIKIEHLDVHKNAPCNIVKIIDSKRTVEKGNVLEIAFDEKFMSKCHHAGDVVHFITRDALYTCEGTLILPANTKILAEVTKIEKPKMFNKNARVSLIFRKIVFPDNSCLDIKAMPFTKDRKLKEGGWTTFGKVFLSTITLGIVGAGAGVGFAFIPNPSKIGTGLAIGIPVGCGVGLITGLVTPGCHYKAKCGEIIYIVLIDNFSVCAR